MSTIFVSYSHMDRKWFDPNYPYALIPWLENSLRRDGATLWYDRSDVTGLQPGDQFERTILDAIDAAQFALLLVSEAFFASTFIQDVELPRILQRAEADGLVVIPILLEPCDWQSFKYVASRQMLPGQPKPLIDYSVNDRDWTHARDEILKGIRRCLRERDDVPIPPPPPPVPKPSRPAASNRRQWMALVAAGVVTLRHPGLRRLGVEPGPRGRALGGRTRRGSTPVVARMRRAPRRGPRPRRRPSLPRSPPAAGNGCPDRRGPRVIAGTGWAHPAAYRSAGRGDSRANPAHANARRGCRVPAGDRGVTGRRHRAGERRQHRAAGLPQPGGCPPACLAAQR